MSRASAAIVYGFQRLGPQMLPFADAATPELPLPRLLRLSLFQVTVGMAAVLLIGTLNRVMIVELAVPSWIVAGMLALPLLFAPLRALIGYRSDHHRSVLGWRRAPFIWFGTMAQFGGFAIMPFALLILSGDTTGPLWVGQAAAALAFLLVGVGLHTVQTVGLALATDLAPERARPRVVALLCAMLLAGMAVSAIIFGLLLKHFSEVRLIQVVQGAAVVTMVLNCAALWKQEPRDARFAEAPQAESSFSQAWSAFATAGRTRRRLIATALGTAGFQHAGHSARAVWRQDLALAGRRDDGLHRHARAGRRNGLDARRATSQSARGPSSGRRARRPRRHRRLLRRHLFSHARLPPLFGLGVALIGFGGGLFAHGTLTASMALAKPEDRGLALGAWGAAQATAAGLAIALSGVVNDIGSSLAVSGAFGDALADPVTGYTLVYSIEVILLFATLVAIGPLVRGGEDSPCPKPPSFAGVALPEGLKSGGLRS